jgi:hypothetical protein
MFPTVVLSLVLSIQADSRNFMLSGLSDLLRSICCSKPLGTIWLLSRSRAARLYRPGHCVPLSHHTEGRETTEGT